MKKLVIIILLLVVLAAFIQPTMAVKPDNVANKTHGYDKNGNNGSGDDKIKDTIPPGHQDNSTPDNKSKADNGTKKVERSAVAEMSANMTIRGVTMIVRDLSIYKDRINDSKMSNESKAAIIRAIDENLTWFASKKAEAENATDVATIRVLATESAQRWYQLKAQIKKETGLLACEEYEAKLGQASNASRVIQSRIDLLRSIGNDTSQAETKLADYERNVAEAASYVAQAREAFNKIDGPVGADAHFRNGLHYLNKADISLKQAYVSLKQLYRLLYGNRIVK